MTHVLQGLEFLEDMNDNKLVMVKQRAPKKALPPLPPKHVVSSKIKFKSRSERLGSNTTDFSRKRESLRRSGGIESMIKLREVSRVTLPRPSSFKQHFLVSKISGKLKKTRT